MKITLWDSFRSVYQCQFLDNKNSDFTFHQGFGESTPSIQFHKNIMPVLFLTYSSSIHSLSTWISMFTFRTSESHLKVFLLVITSRPLQSLSRVSLITLCGLSTIMKCVKLCSTDLCIHLTPQQDCKHLNKELHFTNYCIPKTQPQHYNMRMDQN